MSEFLLDNPELLSPGSNFPLIYVEYIYAVFTLLLLAFSGFFSCCFASVINLRPIFSNFSHLDSYSWQHYESFAVFDYAFL